jgi:hypothetical protein
MDIKMEGVKYGVFATGGSVGTNNDKPWKTFDDKEEAKQYAKRARRNLTRGEKGYYGMGFRVRPIKTEDEEYNSDFEPKTNMCPDCEGEGHVAGDQNTPCERCDGVGEVFEGAVEATVWDAMDHDKDESPEAKKDPTPKMKTPPRVKTALNKEIKELRTDAKKIETSDEMRSEFYTNCANAMEQILGYLDKGTIDGMKDAQVFMTSLMSPIVQRIPDVAYDYITGGGEPAKLKDLFTKVKAKK